MKEIKKIVWIGLLHVKITPESLWENVKEKDVGSYVPFLCLASDEQDVRQQAIEAVEDHNAVFLSLEEIEPFDRRLEAKQAKPYIIEKAKEVLEKGNPRFGTWYDYPEKDEE